MDNSPGFNRLQRPLIFGELLFDTFEDGARHLGGAPFNVAWHLHGLGLNPLLISRVGNDLAGREALAAMRAWGMDTQAVQTDPDHPTGTVQVELEHGQPSFTLLPLQAYDFIDAAEMRTAIKDVPFSLLYHGTLIARTSASHQVLQDLRAQDAAPPVFVDINLRTPWWSGEVVETLLNGARWAKLNNYELEEMVNIPALTREQSEDAARELCQRYALDLLVITQGAQGACFVDREVAQFAPAPEISRLADTVGAGDAFSAVTLLGLLRGWPRELIMQRALEFASASCRIPGSTCDDAEMYRQYRSAWKE